MSSFQKKGWFLEKFDIFGVPITIRFNQRETHKTLAGSICTLIIIGALVYQVFNVVQDLINYVNVNVIFQEQIVSVPKKYPITSTTFPFALGILADSLKYVIEPNIFFITAEFLVSTKFFNHTSNQYEFKNTGQYFDMEPCRQDHFEMANTRDYFLTLPYQQLFCINKKSQIEIEGQYGADIYKRLRFRIKECQGNNCDDKVKRSKVLDNCSFQMFYVNYALQVTNLTQPFQEFGQSYFWKTNNVTMKNINVFFRNSFLESHDGIVFNDLQQYNRLFYSFDREQAVQRYDNTIFELYINLEKNKESYYLRRYLTLSQAFSQIGGLFNFLLCIGALVSRPVSRLIFQQKLLNQIFSFNTDDNEDPYLGKSHILTNNNTDEETKYPLPDLNGTNIELAKKLKRRFSSVNNKSCIMNDINQSLRMMQQFQFNKEDKKPEVKAQNSVLSNSKYIEKSPISESFQFQQQQKKYIEVKNEQINTSNGQTKSKFPSKKSTDKQLKNENKQLEELFMSKDKNSYIVSFGDMLKSMLSQYLQFLPRWQMSAKSKMIEYGLSKLNQHLEINYIIDKLLELEKLKKLLLNYEQIKLFDLVPKPVINKGYFKDNNNDSCNRNSQEITKTHLFHAKNKSLQEKINDAQEAFNLMLLEGKDTLSHTNTKLLQLLDPKLLVYLERNNDQIMKISQPYPLNGKLHSSIKKNQSMQDSSIQAIEPILQKNHLSNNDNNQNQEYNFDNFSCEMIPPEEVGSTFNENQQLPQTFLCMLESQHNKFKIPNPIHSKNDMANNE